jgi:hypothetical protein
VRGVDVGVAQAGRQHAHGYLPCAWLWNWPVLDNERFAEPPYNCCSHDEFSFSLRWRYA